MLKTPIVDHLSDFNLNRQAQRAPRNFAVGYRNVAGRIDAELASQNGDSASSGAVSMWEDSSFSRMATAVPPLAHEPFGTGEAQGFQSVDRTHAVRLSISIPVPELTENRSIKLNTGVSLRDRRNSVVVLYRRFTPASGPRG